MAADALLTTDLAAAPPASAPTMPSSQSVIASMRQHAIGFSAENYTVWHSYLSGTNAALKRAVDIVLSNGLSIDEKSLRALHHRHFYTVRDAQFVRNAVENSFKAIAELRTAGLQVAATSAVDRLADNLQHLLVYGEKISRQLADAEQRSAQLEYFLNDARQEACTDSLTGIANRRAFDETLRTKAAEAMNDGSDLAFVLVDIDKFKLVNDLWGHSVGDDVLRMIAGTLTRHIRGGDMVARYGGEEFAVILPVTGQRGALRTAENLRAATEQQIISVQSTEGHPVTLRVTISAGVSCYTHGEKLPDWLARADSALYRAKNTGRNRVLFEDGPASPDQVLPGRATPARVSNVVHILPRA